MKFISELIGENTKMTDITHAAAKFVMWALMEGSWQGADIDGGAAQDKAVELGLIIEDQYDPKRHGENDSGVSPGEQWFIPSEALLAALKRESAHAIG